MIALERFLEKIKSLSLISPAQRQPNQSELLDKAYKAINDLKSQIVKLEESIIVKDKWLADFNQILIA